MPKAHDILSDAYIKSQRLAGLSLVELTLLRDSIYARRGHYPFRVAWVQAYFDAQDWYKPRRVVLQKDLTDRERENATTIAAVERLHHNTGSLQSHERRLLKRGNLDYTDRVELNLTREYLRRAEVLFDIDITRSLDVNRLRALDRGTLSVLRNQIFARRGRPFHNAALSTYFIALGYEPDPHYSHRRLTEQDWKNADLIRQVEDEKGGPIEDWDDLLGGR